MDQNKNNQQPLHQVETIRDSPTALIATNDGFIGSYLSQKLLELPLKLIFLSSRSLEEVQHLKANNRFTEIVVKSETNLRKETFPKLDYIFQVVNDEKKQREFSQIHKLTNSLLEIASANSAKFQLTITTNSDKDLQEAISTPKGNLLDDDSKSSKYNQKQLQQTVIKFLEEHNLDARVVRLIHAYGPKMQIGNKWAFTGLLKTLRQENKLTIRGEGLIPLYPVFVTDAASALAKAMFTEHLKSETIFVAGEKEITTINLAYKLREMVLRESGQMPEILFNETDEAPQSLSQRLLVKGKLIKSRENLGWEPIVNLEEGLTKTLEWLKHTPKPAPLEAVKRPQLKHKTEELIPKMKIQTKIPKIQKPKTAFKTKKTIVGTILALIVALIIPPIVFLATTGSAALALRKSALKIKQTDINPAINSSKRSAALFQAARNQLGLFSKAIPKSHKASVEEAEAYLEAGQLLAQTLKHAAQALQSSSQLKDIIFSESDNKIHLTLNDLNRELDSLHAKLSLIELLLGEGGELSLDRMPLALDYKLPNSSKDIKALRNSLADVRKIMLLAPKLLSAKGKRTYLVLLQNNAELRPTGGFIGSYALVTFEKGKLLDFSVEDVYTADGQLKGHVEPPAEIKEHLGEAGWYLRDANWNPDFPSAARKIEWFFAKETGKKVDGTIAINLYVIKEILKALGPINLPDYEETIAADNLFKTAEYYSEINFFPGSTQKKDFLASLSKNMFFESEKLEAYKLVKLAAALYTSLERGQLLVSLHDSKAQQVFNDFGWDGSLKDMKCETDKQSCANTFLAVREANLGVNKANYFLNRQISISQNIKTDSIETTLTLNYQNQSPTNKWPGGDYKNYLRIYLSEGSKVIAVRVNGKTLDSSQLSFKAQHNKTVAGFLVKVPVQQESEVTLVTQSDGIRFIGGKALSNLLLQKQPGTENDPLTIELTYPENLLLASSNLPLDIKEGSATLSQYFTEDLALQVEMSR